RFPEKTNPASAVQSELTARDATQGECAFMAAETVANLIFSGPLTWTDKAACHGQSRLFFAPPGERPEARAVREAQARSVCRTCEVLHECREWAREHRE